jgi:hypothetical protein
MYISTLLHFAAVDLPSALDLAKTSDEKWTSSLAELGSAIECGYGVSPRSPARYAEVVRVYEAMNHVSLDVVLRLQDKSITVVRASEKGTVWDLI